MTPFSAAAASPYNASSPGSSRLPSGRPSPSEPQQYADANSERSSSFPAGASTPSGDGQLIEEPVLAKISYHVLREERAFHICKNLVSSADPQGDHFVKPLDLLRLPPQPGDRGAIIVSIYQHPGYNYLYKVVDMGPAFYWTRKVGDQYEACRKADFKLEPQISLHTFLDFAIGAAKCLEMLHHSQSIIHGEIRGDAFHFNVEKNKVRLISMGSGVRSFEHGLTSTGWSTLSKELGAKHKLLYISPEQTGRMPSEPDSRTDIYSLGVVLWSLLTQQPVFDGDSPLDIVQGVLGRRIPNASAIRLDVPDVLGRIIQKCTAKTVGERYHSASGLRHDLVNVRQALCEGNWMAMKQLNIGTKDVSSFFMLPCVMIGRQMERDEVVKVIDRVAKDHTVHQRTAVNRFSDASSLHNESLDAADMSSEAGSSADGTNRRSGSFAPTSTSDPRQSRASFQPSTLYDNQTISGETVSSTQSGGPAARHPRPWDRNQPVSIETRSVVDSVGHDSNRHSMADSSASSLSRQLNNVKYRRRGHCEIVIIEGAAGLGKSFLVQSILVDARRRGYCATAKFDTTRRTAFGPLLKLLSSLFRQVWGERNTDTPFHQSIKQHVRPVWPTLHKVLGLPEFLLGQPETSMTRTSSISHSNSLGKPSRGSLKRRGSSPGNSPGMMSGTANLSSQNSHDYLRSGSATKTMRLMNTFLDVLRMFTTHKFVCFCLDDIHCADDESLDLITQIISSRMKMVIIITHRPDEMAPERVRSIVHPPELEDYPQSVAPIVTKIKLSPLSEGDIVSYVSTTLCRPEDEVLPLALVIQSKTAGNPFYMREMLSACYRKKCVWYEYRDGLWHFDLDRLFEQFQGEKDYDVLDTGFITRRLDELPSASRSVLAWAALIGHSFSFELVCRLLGSEFKDSNDGQSGNCGIPCNACFSQQEAVAGLNAAIQAYILVPSESDDWFRFAHDRYIHAAAALKECDSKRMHFIIAQTLMKYYTQGPRSIENTASHIRECVDIVQDKVRCRQGFRQVLFECAQGAAENGARPTAAKYYSAAVALLQRNPWDETLEDVSYNETIQLHLQAAECYLYMSNYDASMALLSTVFEFARSPLDKAPAFVLQSRILSQSGEAKVALSALKECLHALGVKFNDEPTFQQCDQDFERLSVKIQTTDRAAVLNLKDYNDPALASIGAVLAETISAAWWTDALRFYHLTLVMVDMHLACGAFPQSGMGFVYMATIALSRFNMAHFATKLGDLTFDLLDRFRDPFSMARGQMVYQSFVGHIQFPLTEVAAAAEASVESASFVGDRISTILSVGLTAQLKFLAGENVADVEAYCQYGCEEIPNWHHDTRGGTLILAVRQACRALQGKTRYRIPEEIMTDEHFNVSHYKEILKSNAHNGDRSLLFFETIKLIPLFLYGHYDRAIAIGRRCYENLDLLWSSRNSRQLLLFYGLALASKTLSEIHDPISQPQDHSEQVEECIKILRDLKQKTQDWEVVCNVNYFCWSRFLQAQISELTACHGASIREYEEALDHAAEHNFIFEEALGNYLMASIFIRQRARRSARAALKDAVALYRQQGASGVAEFIEEEHSLLLHGLSRLGRTVDAGMQTDFTGETTSVQYRAVGGEEGDEMNQNNPSIIVDMKGDRIGEWRGSMHVQPDAGAGLPALDMIDLHAILVSSQVISSVLQVDFLLKTMCDVILQTCGGSATLAAIVVHEENNLSLAASGDPERGASAHFPGIPLDGTSLVAENVVLYCTRFREPVFISDLISDERFGNATDGWLKRNPLGKAVIAIPICHGEKPLLGVLYLEGEPGAFTDRNVTVLQLLVNQIGISYSNALAMKNIEKVSAENRSMVNAQKSALKQALEAEQKARNAESEARRHVKLAEEAAKAKSIFLANVSHELRTPLNGVIGNSELLRDSTLNKEQLEMADSIRVSADLLLTVINDILDFSKMEADKMKLFVIAFNPKEMVHEVVRAASYSNREKTTKKNVKIVQSIDLPPMLIFGDPIRLHQVLGNLIGNSLKFTEDGRITIGARVDSETQDSATLTFWVQDTGIGIPPRQLAKLFQPFSQADASTARKYGGSGLGLSICKSLIEAMMKGTIRLESEEGKGTRAWFTVTFDKAKADVTAGDAQIKARASPPMDRHSAAAAASAHQRHVSANPAMDLTIVPKDELRVCIAEDNPINQRIAIQYVQRLGYKTVVAYENGMKAVEGLRQKANEGRPYHIILMDVQMPVLDGYEATKLIRKDPLEVVRKVLIIAMTASAIQGDREKCLAAGMNDYLAKPVRSDVLKRKLDAYVSPPVCLGSFFSPNFAVKPADQELRHPSRPLRRQSQLLL